MQLTKYTHACVRLDDGERSLVIDPGVFSEVDAALDGVHAVLITHEHVDHLDVDALRAAIDRDSALQVWAPAPVADQLDLGDRVTVAAPGDAFSAGGFDVTAHGGQHALIHPSIPAIANVGYVVDGSVYHPGDSFHVPTVPVRALLAPLHAPWSKLSEVIDFVISVRAAKAFNVHDSLLTDTGRNMVESQVGRLGGEHGVEFAHLAPAESVDV